MMHKFMGLQGAPRPTSNLGRVGVGRSSVGWKYFISQGKTVQQVEEFATKKLADEMREFARDTESEMDLQAAEKLLDDMSATAVMMGALVRLREKGQRKTATLEEDEFSFCTNSGYVSNHATDLDRLQREIQEVIAEIRSERRDVYQQFLGHVGPLFEIDEPGMDVMDGGDDEDETGDASWGLFDSQIQREMEETDIGVANDHDLGNQHVSGRSLTDFIDPTGHSHSAPPAVTRTVRPVDLDLLEPRTIAKCLTLNYKEFSTLYFKLILSKKDGVVERMMEYLDQMGERVFTAELMPFERTIGVAMCVEDRVDRVLELFDKFVSAPLFDDYRRTTSREDSDEKSDGPELERLKVKINHIVDLLSVRLPYHGEQRQPHEIAEIIARLSAKCDEIFDKSLQRSLGVGFVVCAYVWSCMIASVIAWMEWPRFQRAWFHDGNEAVGALLNILQTAVSMGERMIRPGIMTQGSGEIREFVRMLVHDLLCVYGSESQRDLFIQGIFTEHAVSSFYARPHLVEKERLFCRLIVFLDSVTVADACHQTWEKDDIRVGHMTRQVVLGMSSLEFVQMAGVSIKLDHKGWVASAEAFLRRNQSHEYYSLVEGFVAEGKRHRAMSGTCDMDVDE